MVKPDVTYGTHLLCEARVELILTLLITFTLPTTGDMSFRKSGNVNLANYWARLHYSQDHVY